MARILFLAFSGGGNLPPSLSIARQLTARGHEVAFAGDPEMMPRMKPTSFRAIELTKAYAQLDRYPRGPFGRWFCCLTSPAVEAQVQSVVEAEDPDFILIDFMFLAALNQAQRFRPPSAAMVHMPLFRVADAFRGLTQMCSGIREKAGFAALPQFDELLFSREGVIVTSLGAIDRAPSTTRPRNVRHVGPALETEAHVQPLNLPWGANVSTPLVLVSFSTDPLQATPDLIQRSLDALGRLDVHVVATIGAGVDIHKEFFVAPPNTLVVAAADHDRLMARAALVVTHGGHGTMMRALKYGVPMIVMPGIAPDQAINGATVEELAAGRVLAQDTSSQEISALAQAVLANPKYSACAREVSKLFSKVDGAARAAEEVEALLARHGLRANNPNPAILLRTGAVFA
jgi:MGT family glycosyltransferase